MKYLKLFEHTGEWWLLGGDRKKFKDKIESYFHGVTDKGPSINIQYMKSISHPYFFVVIKYKTINEYSQEDIESACDRMEDDGFRLTVVNTNYYIYGPHMSGMGSNISMDRIPAKDEVVSIIRNQTADVGFIMAIGMKGVY